MEHWNSWISVSALVNASNISTCSRGFSGFSRPSLSNQGKNANNINKAACIEVAGIRSTYIRDICTRNTNAEDAFSIRGTCIKSVFVGDTNAVKHLKMHLQSF